MVPGKLKEKVMSVLVPMPVKCISEFENGIFRLNLIRGRITAAAFAICEPLVLLLFLANNRGKLREPLSRYYISLYVIMTISMLVFLLVMRSLGRKTSVRARTMRALEISFTGFILLWGACISLIDQISYRQMVVYSVAILAVALTPYIRPVVLLGVYFCAQAFFLLGMILNGSSRDIIFGNMVNSWSFVMVAIVIARVRYTGRINEFLYMKAIEEKNAQLQRLNKKLERLSELDALTGIFNRRKLSRLIYSAWETCGSKGEPVSLVLIDIDYFKQFNDHYGHMAGDECLRKIAVKLSNMLKNKPCYIARYGGEELIVLMPGSNSCEALRLAEKLRESVESMRIPHEYNSVSKYVTVSAGVNTAVPQKNSSIKEFLNDTDRALYCAKRSGRNRVADNGSADSMNSAIM